MAGTGSIKGVVRDAGNRPIGEVAVMIVSGPSHSDIAALTSPDGSFAFSQLRPGRYAIQARGDRAASEPIPLNVRAAKVAFVQIWLDADVVDDRQGSDEDSVDEL
jgi:hypothetical protein